MQYQEYEREAYENRAMQGDGSFFKALFDFSFSEFVTVKIIRVLYVLAMILAILVVVIGVFTAFTQGIFEGIIGLIFAPIVFVVYLVLARVWLEFVVVVFRIADHANEIAVNTAGLKKVDAD